MSIEYIDIPMNAKRPQFYVLLIFLFVSFWYVNLNVSPVRAGYTCNTNCSGNRADCNGSGGDQAWCNASYGDVCRNPLCPAETDCDCPIPPTDYNCSCAGPAINCGWVPQGTNNSSFELRLDSAASSWNGCVSPNPGDACVSLPSTDTTYSWVRPTGVYAFDSWIHSYGRGGTWSSSVLIPRLTCVYPPTSLTGSCTDVSAWPVVSLSWADSSNEGNYQVKKQIDGGAWTYDLAPSPAQNATAFSDAAVTFGHSYVYDVKSCKDATCSDYAYTSGSAVTVVCPTPLPCPNGEVFSCLSSTSGRISWDAIPGASTYGVRVDQDPSADWAKSPQDYSLITANTSVDIPITPGVPYRWSAMGIKPAQAWTTGNCIDWQPWVSCCEPESCPSDCHTDVVQVTNLNCTTTDCPSNAPPATNCPKECGALELRVPDGNCGTIDCPAPPVPPREECSWLPCHTDIKTIPNGDCTTTDCPSNAPAELSCPATCSPKISGPDGNCGIKTCDCVGGAPLAPSEVIAVQNNSDINLPTQVDINWKFGWTEGCGTSWGYDCEAQAYSFTVLVDLNLPKKIIAYDADRSTTVVAGSWGPHTVTVCAVNGYGQTCTSKAFTLTAPVCTVSNTSPASGGCYQSFPSVLASYGNGADEVMYFVDTTNPVVSAYTCSSAWLSGSYAACNPTTGQYYWSAQSQSTNSPVNCSTSLMSPAYSVQVDKDPPPVPVPTVALIPDTSCWGKYKVEYSWQPVSNVGLGCAAMNTTPYWSQASLTPTPAPPALPGFPQNVFPINTWGTYITQTSPSYVPGTKVYTHVRSRDALNNQSAWYESETITIPVPSPYPTIHIDGNFTEDTGTSCVSNIILDGNELSLNPVANPSEGVTFECSNDSGKYSCNITIDNTTGLCVSPIINFDLGATYIGYASVGWHNADTCDGLPETSRSLSVGDNKSNIPLFFQYEGGDAEGNGWFKLSNTSFISRESGRDNFIPFLISLFDSTGDDSIANKHMMIGTAGNIVQDSPIVVGLDTIKYSENNWYTSGYIASTNGITYSKYLEYLKARKAYSAITSPFTAASFPTNGIYSVSENITLNQSWFDGKNIVLVVQGGKKAIFDADFIPPNKGSVAVLASTIEINSIVKEIDAIIIGQTISTGESTTGLKIKGNLIDESALTIDRAQTDGRKPSLFVVFNPETYLNVLPYLSTSTYDWRQIQ